MSIIAALISHRDGMVASDGRIFAPALLENGRVVRTATIESDTFDKTFAIGNGQVIGAFAGLVRFSGKTVADHILEIGTDSLNQRHDLGSLGDDLQRAIRMRLQLIDRDEVIFSERRLDVLLAAGEKLSRAEMRIVSLRFFPNADQIISETDTVVAQTTNRYYLRGDDQAIDVAKSAFMTVQASRCDAESMHETVVNVVQAGIEASGIHKYGSAKDCGGQIFVRRTWYG